MVIEEEFEYAAHWVREGEKPVPTGVTFSQLIDDEQVLCPVCGTYLTYHCGVSVFRRDGESAKTGTKIVVASTVSEVNTSEMVDNPSSRRDGIAILMKCEGGHRFELTLAQHKGVTELGVRTPAKTT